MQVSYSIGKCEICKIAMHSYSPQVPEKVICKICEYTHPNNEKENKENA